jgi:hypothetical protein
MTPVASLESQLFEIIERGERADPSRFDLLALEVFAYQYAQNRPYRAFCDRRRVTPDGIERWQQIPAVPTSAFKVADLTCCPERPTTLFLTSGTTQGPERRGRHLVADLALYRAAILPNAQAHLFPDLPLSGECRLLMLSLTPPPSQRPHSSLIHMIDVFMQRWGATESRYLGQADGLDGEALFEALTRAAADAQPVALFGTTAAFALWFEQCEARGWQVILPPGSRLMDTGGRKRAEDARQPSSPASINTLDRRDLFLATCEHLLGLPAHAIVNEYGMTELGSQFYDDHLSAAFGGRTATGLKIIPPWVRVRVIDPTTGDDVPPGQAGLLCHYDLANLHSIIAVQTDDLGIKPPGVPDMIDGFQLLGRVAGSEPRGCSLDSSTALLPA